MTTVLEQEPKTARAVQGSDGTLRFDFSSWKTLAPPRAPAYETPYPVSGFERLLACGMLALLAPFFLAVAAAIKLDSPGGPVFYRQERVGLDRRRDGGRPAGNGGRRAGYGGPERRAARGYGQAFHIYKFRTMVPDAEKLTGPVWARKRDARVTRLGGVLRKLRIDELPQLINVVRGEMRLIGPRPERPHFVERLAREIPEYPGRHRVPPGITGLAQIEREYDASVSDVERKVKYDLYYVRHRSSILDIKIVLKTIDVALRGRGAH